MRTIMNENECVIGIVYRCRIIQAVVSVCTAICQKSLSDTHASFLLPNSLKSCSFTSCYTTLGRSFSSLGGTSLSSPDLTIVTSNELTKLIQRLNRRAEHDSAGKTMGKMREKLGEPSEKWGIPKRNWEIGGKS